jgi:hypothetical protein
MIRKYFPLATLLILSLLLVSPTVAGQGEVSDLSLGPASQNLIKYKQLTKVTHDLVVLQKAHETHVQLHSLEPFKPSNPYLRVVDGRVVIDAVASGEAKELLTDLEALGLQNGAAFGRMVSGRLPIAAIEKLQNLDSLKFVRPAYMATNVGSVTSQGDAAMGTDSVRNTFGVDGTGVTVGSMSDSFDCRGGAAADVASGDLPAGINVLKDEPGCVSGSDEGRALMQIIHDVAPGAAQAFRTAFDGQADFAQGILELAGLNVNGSNDYVIYSEGNTAGGADVIVDDVIYFAEPMFQDGIIAQAVDMVKSRGIPYFSAAGNSGRLSYEGPFRSGGQAFFYPGNGDAHDFDPGPGVDIFQQITIPEGTFVILVLQWDEPFFSVSGPPGSANDLDIFITSSTGAFVAGSFTFNIGGDPVDIVGYFNPFGSGRTTFNVVIEKFGGGPDPGLIKYVFVRGSITIDEFDTASGTNYGHANAAGAEAVGAAFYGFTPAFGQNPPLLEPFSSAGSVPILFDTDGNRLASPEIRQKPEIVGPDGTNTTFFGEPDPILNGAGLPMDYPVLEGDGWPNFFGTSASAPHAAGLAALMIEGLRGEPTDTASALNNSNSLMPDLIYQALESTAIDMNTPGFDYDSGFGLIDAVAAYDLINGAGSWSEAANNAVLANLYFDSALANAVFAADDPSYYPLVALYASASVDFALVAYMEAAKALAEAQATTAAGQGSSFWGVFGVQYAQSDLVARSQALTNIELASQYAAAGDLASAEYYLGFGMLVNGTADFFNGATTWTLATEAGLQAAAQPSSSTYANGSSSFANAAAFAVLANMNFATSIAYGVYASNDPSNIPLVQLYAQVAYDYAEDAYEEAAAAHAAASANDTSWGFYAVQYAESDKNNKANALAHFDQAVAAYQAGDLETAEAHLASGFLSASLADLYNASSILANSNASEGANK